MVTGFLAYFTYRSVKSGYDREKSRRKEDLLKEIIEWATDISKCGIDSGIDFYMIHTTKEFEAEEIEEDEEDIKKDSIEVKEAERKYWSRLLSEYLHLSKKCGYIKIITNKKIKKEALNKSVEKLVEELDCSIKLIRKGITGTENMTTTTINIQRDELGRCLDSTIDVATNLLDEIT